jgi:hypothetical protein
MGFELYANTYNYSQILYAKDHFIIFNTVLRLIIL